ncbi:MAG TPA: hypothetical protein VK427_25755 [Kofleriaceae bacterium]|nr:hypothetical protein [Kofleriaceae bacterium]
MRTLLVLVLLAACKGDKPPPAPTPTPTPTSPAVVVDAQALVDACAIGRFAVDKATCQSDAARGALAKAKKSLDGVLATVGQTTADPRQLQVMCSTMLLAIERDAAKASCTLALDALHRADIMALLDEWYAQRTPLVPTGDAAADAVIAKIAAIRDAACECRDGACLNKLDAQLGGVGTMPANAPEAARTLGSKLLEDAARCANRVRTITDPPK